MKVDTKEKDLKDFRKELYVMEYLAFFFCFVLDRLMSAKSIHLTLSNSLEWLSLQNSALSWSTWLMGHFSITWMTSEMMFKFLFLSSSSFKLPWSRFFDWATEVTKGVHTLHTFETPIVHRDLKPLNLLISDDFHVKVCDFGLSRFTDENQKVEEMQTLTKLVLFLRCCSFLMYSEVHMHTLHLNCIRKFSTPINQICIG